MNHFDQARKLLDLYDVASSYVDLKPLSENKYRALCPFHVEKTPSLIINNENQLWYCFGCKKGGTVIQFISEQEKISGAPLLHFINNKYKLGLELDKKIDNAETDIQYKVLNYFFDFFKDYTIESNEYLKLRIRNFDDRLKYNHFYVSTDKAKTFVDTLPTEFIPSAKKLNIIAESKNGVLFCTFSGRVMFPITRYEKIVGFNGRIILDEKSDRKYLLTASGDVFKKSELVYGLDFAKKLAKNRDVSYVYITEGILDTISLLENGIPAVSVLGSSISLEQFSLLQKNFDTMYIALDNDKAGKDGVKSLYKAIDGGLSISGYIVKIDEYKDVNEYLNKKTTEDFFKLKTKSFEDVYINFYISEAKKALSNSEDVAEVRTKFLTFILPELYDYRTNSFSKLVIMRIAERIGYDPERLFSLIDRQVEKAQTNIKKSASQTEPENLSLVKSAAEYKLLQLAFSSSSLIEQIEKASWFTFLSPLTKDILDILKYDNDSDIFDIIERKSTILKDKDKYMKIVMMLTKFSNPGLVKQEYELLDELFKLKYVNTSKTEIFLKTVQKLRRNTGLSKHKEKAVEYIQNLHNEVEQIKQIKEESDIEIY